MLFQTVHILLILFLLAIKTIEELFCSMMTLISLLILCKIFLKFPLRSFSFLSSRLSSSLFYRMMAEPNGEKHR